jgi:hypothetical protein
VPAARAEKANRFRHPGGNYSRKNEGAPPGLAVELVKLDFSFENTTVRFGKFDNQVD